MLKRPGIGAASIVSRTAATNTRTLNFMAITGLKRVSKPGLRAYVSKNRIPRVLGGYGIAIVSTSQGILPDAEARTRGVGGEVICEVW